MDAGIEIETIHAQVPDSNAIQRWLRARIATYLDLDVARIDIEKPFASYGLTSVDAVGLSGDLEDWLGRSLSPTLVYDYPTIRALAQYLAGDDTISRSSAQAIRQSVETIPDTAAPEAVAVIGVGCRFPGGADSPDRFWQLLRAGYDAVTEIPPERWQSDAYFDPDPQAPGKMYTRRAAFVRDLDEFDASFFGISPREALRMDPQQRLLLEVAWEALERAGLRADQLAGSATGVFVGQLSSQEYALLQATRDNPSYLDDPYFSIGSSASVTAGRLAYLLDLHGPTITIDTACSSSLVCVHLALQSLRRRECDLAIVAGVNAILLPESMINACKMSMLAADGHCKTFDEAADGFVLGEGCGVVVLKRAEDALNACDPILALLRGSAVNQDGRSNGLTAPNRLAQEAVIRQALADARVQPWEIDYVEAHGSGTALGDPIEIEALQHTLGQERKDGQALLVGAVKTNIGHLAGAAGIASLIKTILMLQHGEIPPHLHLQRLNPNISRLNAPVTIPTALHAWPHMIGRRMAGVNSFGWSGTNAHVVLQEAPSLPQEQPSTSPPFHQYILTLSAKTESALERATDNLTIYLQEHPEVPLSDIAYTCQLGRVTFSHRRMLLCQNREEAIARLSSRDPQYVFSHTDHENHHPLVFLFPGVGDQYANMARQLYDDAPVFWHAIDACCEYLQPLLGYDLRTLLYPSMDQEGQNTQALTRTDVAQPLQFVVEYALAQYWLSLGVRPHALLGYSLGEYVAACLAGVFSLEDALLLVARRAQLIQSLPAGAMSAIMLSEAELRPRLPDGLSLAAVNGPLMCVVAGPLDTISVLERSLLEQGIASRRLQTEHAFHSYMMEPVAQEFITLVKTISLHAPTIPYLSNVTGTWIAAEEATDPSYWGRHLCQTVRFSDCIEQLLQQNDKRLLLEVGTGQMLSSLVLQSALGRGITDIVILPTLPSMPGQQQETELLLGTIGRLWLEGIAIAWNGLYADHDGQRRIALPTYPFEHERYWLSSSSAIPAVSPQRQITGKKLDRIEDWFYVPVWKQSLPLLVTSSSLPTNQMARWLVFAEPHSPGAELVRYLNAQGIDAVMVMSGQTFSRLDETHYTLRQDRPDEYVALLKHLRQLQRFPTVIIHAWSLGAQPTSSHAIPLTMQDFASAQEWGFYSVLFLVQALGSFSDTPSVELALLSDSMQNVLGNEQRHPEQATLLGLTRVIAKEYPRIRCRSIDISMETLHTDTLVETLVQEMATASESDVVAYRGSQRWLQTFESLPLEDTGASGLSIQAGKTYLITGGLGGLGLACASYFARVAHVNLVLLGRTPLPAREHWERWLSEHAENDTTSARIRKIQSLEALGSIVYPVAADIADVTEMQAVVEEVHSRLGPLHGVVHAAGLPGAGMIQLKTPEMAERVFRAKAQGVLVLSSILRSEPLDFMLLYSSSAAITGGLGEVDYCAANAFLDAYAQYHRQHYSLPMVSINWGPWQWDSWQSTLFAALPELQQAVRTIRDTYGISFEDGEQVLQRLPGQSLAQLLVLPQGFEGALRQAQELASLHKLDTLKIALPNRPRYARPNLRTSYVAPRNETERKVATIWQELLGIDQVGIYDHFFELGGNSLIGMLIIARLKQAFGIEIPATTLFESPTISTLAEVIQPQRRSEDAILEPQVSRGQRRRARRPSNKTAI